MTQVSSIIERNVRTCYTQIDHEMVVLNPEDDQFYHLNHSAVDLWLSLETPKTILELSHILAQKYAGDVESYQHDIVKWVSDAQNKGLLIIQDAS
jgi:hypothetical protein